MNQSEIATINMQIDTEEVEISAEEVSKALTGLKEIAENICTKISDTFSVALDAIEIFKSSVDKLSESVQSVTGENFSGVLTELSEISTTLDSILAELQTPDWLGGASLVLDTLNTIEVNKPKRKARKNKEGGIKVKVRKKSSNSKTTSSKASASGIAAGGIGAAVGLDALDGDIGDLLGDILGTDTLQSLFSGLSTAISDAGQKLKDFGSAIGTAFKSFGTMISQLVTGTGAWIADTAAKAGNTAAQWAQIAATTAWQGICTAATAVTTAFGAAMNFLTSPIGLVVLAVAALIAIIVALIANWDAVKEAAAKAWESITQTVEKVTNFLLEKLNGFNEFLQGVFAKDWTEQFGAFGSVLNAFFANFENVWNAVKGIFDGMIGFVKNVFAGNWGAAWESIVGVFKGIWDYLVAVVKAPINAIIGLINGLVQGVVDGINAVIGMLNKFKVEIPDWGIFGDYAGATLGFNIASIKAPQIPYLAQGAVLPANKPFLAMVGDQKHGTNVEAPLATIQEAVALVMEEQTNGMMAGFNAMVSEVRALRRTVDGIEVGDTVIGQAANRYNRKMAVIHGNM